MKTLQEKKTIEQYSSLSKKNEMLANLIQRIYTALGPKKICPESERLVMH